MGVVADDLTGALDTAVKFLPLVGRLRYFVDPKNWRPGHSFAFNIATREVVNDAAAASAARSLAAIMASVAIPYKKIDSLLRGSVAAELAAIYDTGLFHACLLAPASPEQGRSTSNGRQQLRRRDGTMATVGPDLVAELCARQVPAVNLGLGDGVDRMKHWAYLADASSMEDLHRNYVHFRDSGSRILYCGSAGLAEAIAGPGRRVRERLSRPFLFVVGSFHDATRRQVGRLKASEQVSDLVHCHGDDPLSLSRQLAEKLRLGRDVVLSFHFAEGTCRTVAQAEISRALGSVFSCGERPGTLAVVGGETLSTVVHLLGAEGVDLIFEVLPGVPASALVGGPWHGVSLVSKSGAFGDASTLLRVMRS